MKIMILQQITVELKIIVIITILIQDYKLWHLKMNY